jgi:hypothetical protein
MSDNIVGLNTEKDANVAQLERIRREKPLIIELQKELAEIKYATYKSYVDAGFTEEQALVLLSD